MTDQDGNEALRKKYFPRVPWTEQGPVRRRYLAKAADGSASVTEALARLAEREGFVEPGRHAVIGNAEASFAAFCDKAAVGMVFGTELSAHWCDAACGEPDAEGWQELIVRSEEGENLTALAHAKGALRFRRAQ